MGYQDQRELMGNEVIMQCAEIANLFFLSHDPPPNHSFY